MNTTTATINAHALARWLRVDDLKSLSTALRDMHPADIVGVVGEFTPDDTARVLLCLDQDKQATLFGYFPPETQVALAEAIDRRDMARIFGAMAHDERADLFAELDEAQKSALLPGLAQAEREDMRKLAAYPEGTVGSLIGMSLPFLLSKFKLDPAAASAPLITSLADAIGVVIYFAMASWLLGLPTS